MHRSRLVCVALVLATSSRAFASNDCSTATAIGGVGAFPFNTTTATTGQGWPTTGACPNIGRNVWFAWTSPASGIARIQTCGAATFDTAIAVYPAPGCPTTAPIACDDDACGLESLTTWIVSAGATYMLEIGSSGGGPGGTGQFTIDVTSPPANDDCATPDVIAGTSIVTYDTTQATTGSQGQGHPSCNSIDKDLWWSWTANQNGTATLETCSLSGDDTNLAVYTGPFCPTQTPLVCNDDFCGTQSQVTFPVSVGDVFVLQIGTVISGLGGPSSFSIAIAPNGIPGAAYCSGDGTAAACPCGNSGQPDHGCANSVSAAGARLDAVGIASVTQDTVELQGSSMPATTSALYFQGTLQQAGGLGVVFGDGLRCVGGTILRLGTKTNVAGASGYGGPLGDVPISIRGLVPASGATRQYQAWYRNAAAFCTASTFNLTNGLEIVWVP